jgi:UDP-N-acetylmuramoyl-L-alanyl-D-glutamate--2,6-diaminopimelate ligase
VQLQRLLATLADDHVGHLALEASSHGLAQYRLDGVRFAAAGFTNLTRDHLDYHGTQEAYIASKMRLLEFAGLQTIAFNAGDPVTREIGARLPAGVAGIGFSAAGQALPGVRTLVARRVDQMAEGLRMVVDLEGCQAELLTPVFGDYNAENILGALAVLLGMGYGLTDAVERLGKVRPVPGRMEHFRSSAGVSVVVDYAHTPDALEGVLKSLKVHCRGRLCVVFGCGGERDRGKRPLMGRVAGRLADHVIVTDDNPRCEDGDGIVADVLAGCAGRDIRVERDRRQAMQMAIESAGADDIILIAGKGHESFQDVDGTKRPFDDREVTRDLLRSTGPLR